jgi:hypothetical protein
MPQVMGSLAPGLLFILLLTAAGSSIYSEETGELRLNQLQFIGTHNSYHVALPKSQLQKLGRINRNWENSLNYTHRSLTDQLEDLGIRHFELDLFADPKGGHLLKKGAFGLLGLTAAQPENFRKALSMPGFKILHEPSVDYLSTTPSLISALKEIKAWSLRNPSHPPLFILLEMKENSPVPFAKKPISFTRKTLEAVETEILTVFKINKIITPDSVRGKTQTLRQAVREKGWPTLEASRSKVMFGLDNSGKIRDLYLKGNPSLEGRLLFASVGENDPGAAWFKLNDPVRDFARIQRLVRAGFMVRTRADSDTREARMNDTRRRDRALASGAQFISTDFPESKPDISNYSVRFQKAASYRHNPVSQAGKDRP